MMEGSIAFQNESIIRLEGPLGLVQMLETGILNLCSFATLVSTNANRYRQLVGHEIKLLEFGLRRAQGRDGGESASLYSFMGGFDGTSNMAVGLKYGVPVGGTMAHSYVTSFQKMSDIEGYIDQTFKEKVMKEHKDLSEFLEVSPHLGELACFISYAQHQPHNFTCLIDTYDTLKSGLVNYLSVALILIAHRQVQPKGVRLDSGDLCQLSIEVKDIIRKVSLFKNQPLLNQIKVVASDGINESKLTKFIQNQAQIDVYGIGTNLVTCESQPALGMVYKLVHLDNLPIMKLSSSIQKATLPALKSIYRIYNQKA